MGEGCTRADDHRQGTSQHLHILSKLTIIIQACLVHPVNIRSLPLQSFAQDNVHQIREDEKNLLISLLSLQKRAG
jgi:hypothetical protein